MLARLILALLLAAFAFPTVAPAACHDVPVERGHARVMDHRSEHRAPAHEPDQMAPHGCIGCIPPSAWIAARFAPAISHRAAELIERAAVLDIGTGPPPALRPPRGA